MRTGQQISHYRILEKLGGGGMGVVYRAEDTVLKRVVALKFFLPDRLGNEDAKARLIREAQAASVLDHPNICTIHEVQEDEDGRLFICMGYCEGVTLRKKLQGPPLRESERLDIAIQIAEGLRHAHEKGIIHRDIKPENIAISSDGRVRIMDFGLAKHTGDARITQVTETGAVAGTLAYMSPEQVKGREVDHRTDIWSFGITLYELVMGKTPFGGLYEAAALYSIVNEKPTPPSQIDSSITADLESVILKTLEKRPENRYQSMGEVLEDLESVRSGIAGDSERAIRGTRRTFGRRKGGKRAMIAALVSTAVVVSALFISGTFSADVDPVSVAVLDFENSAGEEGFDRILAGLLSTDLAQTPSVRVLSRERMRELQEEMDIERIDGSTGFELAKQAGVQMLISGKVVKIGEKLRVDASVFDVATQEMLFARHEVGESRDSVFEMIDDLSTSIRKELKVMPKWGGYMEPSLAVLTTRSVDAYGLFSKGEDLRNSKPEEAVAFMEQAVAQDTTFAEAYMELALLYNHQLGDPEKALQNALRAKELSRAKSPKEYLKALVYESWVLCNWDGVVEYIRRYLELQPNDMRIQRRLGWVLARQEATYYEAISHFQKMIEMDPDNISGEISSACNHLGNLHMHLGNFEEAIDALEQYRALSPGRPGPLHSIGNAYMLSGRYEDAVLHFKQILEDNPRYYDSYESLGMTYLAMGKWRDALAAFRRYATVAPEGFLSNAHMRLAEVYCRQEDFASAEKEIEEALLLDPNSLGAHWRKGLIALATEGCAGARRELKAIEGLLQDPCAADETCYVNHLSGRIRLAEGRAAEGLADLRRAVGAASRDKSYCFNKELVKGYLDAGLTDEAVGEASALLEYNPNDGEVLSLLGLACEKKGDRGQMAGYLQRALGTWQDADRDFAPLKEVQARL